MKLTTGQRALVLAVVALAALASLLYAKYAALLFVLQHRGSVGFAMLALFAAVVAGTGRLVRASGVQIASVLTPLAVVLFVSLVVTPLPFEVEHQALLLPRPAGESAPPEVTRAVFYDMGHPAVYATFHYAAERNVTQLALDSVAALQSAGWHTFEPTLPGGRTGRFATLSAERAGLFAACTIGRTPDGAETTSVCSVSVP